MAETGVGAQLSSQEAGVLFLYIYFLGQGLSCPQSLVVSFLLKKQTDRQQIFWAPAILPPHTIPQTVTFQMSFSYSKLSAELYWWSVLSSAEGQEAAPCSQLCCL